MHCDQVWLSYVRETLINNVKLMNYILLFCHLSLYDIRSSIVVTSLLQIVKCHSLILTMTIIIILSIKITHSALSQLYRDSWLYRVPLDRIVDKQNLSGYN